MGYSLWKRAGAALFSVGLITGLLGVLAPVAGAAPPDAVAIDIDFRAADPTTYTPADGTGGEWADTVTSLANFPFACSDQVVFLTRIAVTDAPSTRDLEIDFEFDATTTGQPDSGFDDLVVAAPNTGDAAHTSASTAVTIVSESLQPTGNSRVLNATVRISGLEEGATFILRTVLTLTCPAGLAPTGTIHSKIEAARDVTSPPSTRINTAGGDIVLRLPSSGCTGQCDGDDTGSIPVHKEDDAGTAMDAVEFQLYTDSTLGTPVSGKSCTTAPTTGDCTIADVAAGSYYVAETNAPANYIAAAAQPVTVTSGPTSELTFVNTRSGTLRVTKTFTDNVDDAYTLPDGFGFEFDVACTKADSTPVSITNQTVADGATWTSDPIPVGYACTVTEDTSADKLPDPGAGTWDAPDYTNNGATIAHGGSPLITISNTRSSTSCQTDCGPGTGSVSIHKQDDLGDAMSGLTFQLYADSNGSMGAAESGKSCTTDSNGDCTITDVVYGTYWVDETTDLPDYTEEAAKQVTVTGDGTSPATVTFVNTYTGCRTDCGGNPGPVVSDPDPVTGPLVITKSVEGVPAAEIDDYTFTFSVDCSDDAFDGTVNLIGEDTGTYHSAIPQGVVCEVSETGISPQLEIDEWTLTGVSDSDGGVAGTVTIADAAGESVTFTNSRSQTLAGGEERPPAPAPAPPSAAPGGVVQPAPVAQEAPRGATLARTGMETSTLLLFAGLALVLGGLLYGGAEIGGRRQQRVIA